MYTEDEAKQKWCPKTLHSVENDQGDFITCGTRCLGSACMAWRWMNNPDGTPAYGSRKDGESTTINEPLGFCGLAGRPE